MIRLILKYLTVSSIFFPNWINAHPHEWIEIHLTPKTNPTGELVALQERWTFDPYSAQMYIEPILASGDKEKQKKAFQKFADEVNESLVPQQYYTYGDQPFAEVTDGKLEVNKAGDLIFSFTLPLKKPATSINYKIYESTYFIEMRYADDQKTHWENGCTLSISESEPDEEQYMLASGLDRGEKAPEGLGELFAQFSTITCSGKK